MQHSPVHIYCSEPGALKLLMVRSQSENTECLMFPLLPNTWPADHLDCSVAPLHVVLCSLFKLWVPRVLIGQLGSIKPSVLLTFRRISSVPDNTLSWSWLDHVTQKSKQTLEFCTKTTNKSKGKAPSIQNFQSSNLKELDYFPLNTEPQFICLSWLIQSVRCQVLHIFLLGINRKPGNCYSGGISQRLLSLRSKTGQICPQI